MVLDMRNPHQLLAFGLLKLGDERGNRAEIFSTVTDIGDVAQLGEPVPPKAMRSQCEGREFDKRALLAKDASEAGGPEV